MIDDGIFDPDAECTDDVPGKEYGQGTCPRCGRKELFVHCELHPGEYEDFENSIFYICKCGNPVRTEHIRLMKSLQQMDDIQ